MKVRVHWQVFLFLPEIKPPRRGTTFPLLSLSLILEKTTEKLYLMILWMTESQKLKRSFPSSLFVVASPSRTEPLKTVTAVKQCFDCSLCLPLCMCHLYQLTVSNALGFISFETGVGNLSKRSQMRTSIWDDETIGAQRKEITVGGFITIFNKKVVKATLRQGTGWLFIYVSYEVL